MAAERVSGRHEKFGKKYLKLGHVQFRRALKNVLVHLTGMPDDHAKILLD